MAWSHWRKIGRLSERSSLWIVSIMLFVVNRTAFGLIYCSSFLCFILLGRLGLLFYLFHISYSFHYSCHAARYSRLKIRQRKFQAKKFWELQVGRLMVLSAAVNPSWWISCCMLWSHLSCLIILSRGQSILVISSWRSDRLGKESCGPSFVLRHLRHASCHFPQIPE